MLVLSRKDSEIIHIGENVVIKVIYASNGSVKIGIDAPREIRVQRGETVAAGAQPVVEIAKSGGDMVSRRASAGGRIAVSC